MLSNNLRYYRMIAGLTQEELAQKVNVTKMAISNYESGKREADSSIILKLAKALKVKSYNLVLYVNPDLHITHGDFKKRFNNRKCDENLVFATVDRYLNRFFNIVNILGGNVLAEYKPLKKLQFDKPQTCAEQLRAFLQLPASGPIPNLINILECKGFIIWQADNIDKRIAGMNGLVNKRPYMMINSRLSPETQRFTIVHELFHILYNFAENIDDKAKEKLIDTATGLFFVPADDLKREIGLRRTNILGDLGNMQVKYGISLMTILIRAKAEKIIDSIAYKKHLEYIKRNNFSVSNQYELKVEKSTLFQQLVLRALSENLINEPKAIELLGYTLEEQLLSIGRL